MNYARYLVAFALAGMVFAGVFYSQQSRFLLLKTLKNPFEQTVDIITLDSPDPVTEEKTLITQDGEIVGLYPGTLFSSSEGTKELQEGEIFVSAVLIGKEDLNAFIRNDGAISVLERNSFDPSLFGLDTSDFSPQDLDLLFGGGGPAVGDPIAGQSDTERQSQEEEVVFRPQFSFADNAPRVGEIKVGPVFVRYPLSSVFLMRNRNQQKTTIYAYGGAVDIFFEGAYQPFVLPSHHKVTIYDSLVSEKTSELFYTKLQKDFRLQKFDTFGIEEDSDEYTPESRIVDGWQYQEEFRGKMGMYAQKAYKTLISSPTGFGVGSVVESFGAFQQKVAVGYPKRKENIHYFESTLRPLVEVFQSVELNGAQADLIGSLGSVRFDIASPQWKEAGKQDGDLFEKWDSFAHAHQAFVRTASKNDTASSFYDFWNDTDVIDTFGDLQHLFFDSQVFLTLDKKIQARDLLVRMRDSFQKLSFSKNHREDLTTMRRVLLQMLKRSSFLQSEEVFSLYQQMVQEEISLYPEEQEITQEIRLEIARDSLYFLNKYLEQNTNIKVSQILLDIYKAMDVEEVKGRLQRNIFSKEETEVITFITLLGPSNITKEEIQRIKELQEIESEIERFNEDLFIDPDTIDPVEEIPDGYIKDETGLTTFFEEADLNLYKLRTSVKVAEEVILFEGVSYRGYSLSGEFNIPRQSFDVLDTGVFTKEGIRKRFFEGILREIDVYEETKEEQEQEDEFEEDIRLGTNVSQNDRLTLLRKKYVVDLLQVHNVASKINQVTVLNKERTLFRVKDVEVRGILPKVRFTYDTQAKQIQSVSFESGQDYIDLDESFALEGVAKTLEKAIDLLLNPPKEVLEEE